MIYPHFIQVHNGEGNTCSVNIDHIVAFSSHSLMVSSSGIKHYLVRETYEELKKLIEDTGCLIQMGDPRLDNHPLTMNRLKDMIGQPVWDSNKQAWGLVCDQFDGLVRIRGYKGASYDYNADDLVRFPVYGIRIQDSGSGRQGDADAG
jgi:hypothetical protein